jgi:hypothetical protein
LPSQAMRIAVVVITSCADGIYGLSSAASSRRFWNLGGSGGHTSENPKAETSPRTQIRTVLMHQKPVLADQKP